MRVILHAVETYTRNSAKDIRDLQNTVGEMDGRYRRDLEQVHGSLGSIHNGQKDILRSHEDSRAREESQARAKEDRKIIDWLSPFNFRAKQNDVLSSRSGSTGTWILETEEFRNWAIGSGKILWCTGIPGAGKTVFTSIVVDHLRRIVAGPKGAISYVYCSYKDEAIQTPTSLIASILQQILTETMAVSDDLRALYEHHELNKTRPTVEELAVQLQAYVRNFEKFFVVIDALDECPDVKREELLNHMRNLQPAVNLMITTRPASHVANGFPEAACVEIRAKDTDIKTYCEAKIRSDHRLHFVQDDADLMDVVINTIAGNAQNMFLLAVLHIESLASQLNKAQVRNALEKLPKGLDDTYHEALQRIAHQGQTSIEMANQVLSWVSYAYRPLTIEELRCALAVTPGLPTFDEDAMTPKSTLVSVCAGLVTIDPHSNIIRLVHYTTQEFFEKIRDSRFPTAQADITLTCLTYLSFDHPTYYDTSYSAILPDIESSPFLSYAAQHWRDHMRASPEPNFNELILQILWQPKKVQCIFQAMNEYTLNFSSLYTDFNVPPLCAAAILGLESVVPLLLERGADLTKSVLSDGATAFYLAAQFVQLEVIKILIECGASVNDQVWTPLSAVVSAVDLTSENGAVAAARLLLDQGADVDSQADYGQYNPSPLIYAARLGSVQLVELLLTYGADANLRMRHGLTALHMANHGKPRIIQLLVSHGADLNARSNSGESPLLRVSRDSRGEAEGTVRVLLDLGADIHSRNKSGETALFKAAERGYCRIIQVLIDYGADIHALSELGRSVLFSAIERTYGQPNELVALLLDHGADVHPQDSAGDTALARAAANGQSGTVKLILDHKPQIDTSNGAGDTALTLAAATEGTLKGSNPYDERGNRIDDRIRMAAVIKRNLVVIELLLNHGACVDLKNKAGNTALTLVAAKGKLDAVKLLLEHGANVDTRNEAGDTALTLAAAAEGTLNESSRYDERGNRIDDRIRMAASIKRNPVIVELLLNYRASVDLKNKTGDTALTLAAATGKLDAVKLLLSHGANAHVKNEAGDTALSLTTQNGHSEVHQLLLEHLSKPKQPPVCTEVE